jgi:hypothetical protein
MIKPSHAVSLKSFLVLTYTSAKFLPNGLQDIQVKTSELLGSPYILHVALILFSLI